jgi:hypothetical protein
MDNQEANWKYTSDADNPEITQPRAKNKGPIAGFSWKATIGPIEKKSPAWYMVLIIITVIIAGAVFLLTKDKISTGVVVLCGVVFGVYAARKPREIEYSISDVGFTIGLKKYNFSSFKSFSIVDNSDTFTLSFTPLRRFMPSIYLTFSRTEESKINGIVGQKLAIEKTNGDLLEKFTRLIRF